MSDRANSLLDGQLLVFLRENEVIYNTALRMRYALQRSAPRRNGKLSSQCSAEHRRQRNCRHIARALYFVDPHYHVQPWHLPNLFIDYFFMAFPVAETHYFE